MITAEPLSWPPGVPRTPAAKRGRSRFSRSDRNAHGQLCRARSVTLAEGRDQLLAELRRLGATDVVISSNVRLRLDGLPRSGQPEPADPAVAVYFDFQDEPRCLPCDRWHRVADNLVALAKFVESIRGQARWVGHDMVRSVFTGFRALPAPGQTTGVDPWYYLGLDRDWTADVMRAQIRTCLREAHPDKGGSAEDWQLTRWSVAQVREQMPELRP